MNSTRPKTSPTSQVEQPEFIENERHERTGSVKFADQPEETKEVRRNETKRKSQRRISSFFRVRYNVTIRRIRKIYGRGEIKWRKNFKLKERRHITNIK